MTTLDTAPRMETETPVRRRAFGSLLGGAILVVLGGLWALDLAGVFSLEPTVVLPAVLIVIGLALVIGAADGPHSGLVVAGVFLSVAVVAAAAIPLAPFTVGVGDRRYLVTDQADLAPRYQLGLGNLVLDLSDLDLEESATVAVSVGAGDITVILPADTPVAIDATTGAGEVGFLGETTEGVALDRQYQSEGFDIAPIGLSLDLDVGAGRIEVTR